MIFSNLNTKRHKYEKNLEETFKIMCIETNLFKQEIQSKDRAILRVKFGKFSFSPFTPTAERLSPAFQSVISRLCPNVTYDEIDAESSLNLNIYIYIYIYIYIHIHTYIYIYSYIYI